MAGTTPSNYIEVRNKDNVFLFSDTTRLMHIVEKGEVSAVSYDGEIYGFELEDGVESISYSIRNGTLYISPVTKWNGKRYQYVTADSESPIKYFKWSRKYFPPMEHGAGIELRDANGNVVFNNHGYLGSFKKSFYTTVQTEQNMLEIKDAPQQSGLYATDGFPALYMCLCAKMWGVYRVHHEEEGKGGFLGLFHDSWDVTDGFIFAPLGKLPPGPSYDTIIPAEMNSVCQWGVEDCFNYGAFNDGRKCKVNLLGRWDYTITPSDSLMAPQTIWLPAMTTLEAIKDTCYTYGYFFQNTEDGIKVSLESRVTRLHFKTLKGEGSLECLNNVVYTDSSTETHVTIGIESGDISSSSVRYRLYDNNGREIIRMEEPHSIWVYSDTKELVPFTIERSGEDSTGAPLARIAYPNVKFVPDGDGKVLNGHFETTDGRIVDSRTLFYVNKKRNVITPYCYADTFELFPHTVEYPTDMTDVIEFMFFDDIVINEKIEKIAERVSTHYALTEGVSCDFSIAHIVSTI